MKWDYYKSTANGNLWRVSKDDEYAQIRGYDSWIYPTIKVKANTVIEQEWGFDSITEDEAFLEMV